MAEIKITVKVSNWLYNIAPHDLIKAHLSS